MSIRVKVLVEMVYPDPQEGTAADMVAEIVDQIRTGEYFPDRVRGVEVEEMTLESA